MEGDITLPPELSALLQDLVSRVAELEDQARAQDEAWTVWRQLEGRCDAHDGKFRELFRTMAEAAGVRPPRHLALVPPADAVK